MDQQTARRKVSELQLTSQGTLVGAHGGEDGVDVRAELVGAGDDSLCLLDGEIPNESTCRSEGSACYSSSID